MTSIKEVFIDFFNHKVLQIVYSSGSGGNWLNQKGRGQNSDECLSFLHHSLCKSSTFYPVFNCLHLSSSLLVWSSALHPISCLFFMQKLSDVCHFSRECQSCLCVYFLVIRMPCPAQPQCRHTLTCTRSFIKQKHLINIKDHKSKGFPFNKNTCQ